MSHHVPKLTIEVCTRWVVVCPLAGPLAGAEAAYVAQQVLQALESGEGEAVTEDPKHQRHTSTQGSGDANKAGEGVGAWRKLQRSRGAPRAPELMAVLGCIAHQRALNQVG